MKKRFVYMILALLLFLFGLTHAEVLPASQMGSTVDSPLEPKTIVPEGVAEIDLRIALGDKVFDIEDAWMLNAGTCVLLQRLPEARGYELTLISIPGLSILSQTPVPQAAYFIRQSWDGSALRLLFNPERSGKSESTSPHIEATIAKDGAVNVGVSTARLTAMPGGQTAIRETDNGSLYAVELATGAEELLIQGVAGLGGGLSYEDFLGYIPWPDDVGYDGVGPWGHPEPTPLLKDEAAFQGYDILIFRQFYVYKALDEHRFAYAVNGWEWGAGFGVYDLRTRTDHRITGRGDFYGMGGNMLYGSALMADFNTYESLPLPETVQEQLSWASSKIGYFDYSISPDGTLLALSGMKSVHDGTSTVTLTEIQTGNVIKTYDIYNPFATECTVAFYSDTRLMLFCVPEEHGSAYIYLISVDE